MTETRRLALGIRDLSAGSVLPEAGLPPAEAWVMEAVRLVQAEQPEAALEACDRALALAPGYSQGWLFRGVALHRLGRYAEAYRCYERALEQEGMRPCPRSWKQQIRLWLHQMGQVAASPL
jgi:tetratricopeptide (TPR) repeat protein